MLYASSPIAVAIFATLVAIVLGLSFYLGRKAKSAKGYFAAHGEVHWFVNGVAFAGDYLSAASFLGICGYIAYYGYDGFLYSIGFLAGWVVALFLIAEPIKRLGKFTFADALDSQFNSRGIKFTAAVSTLIVSIFYLIPQMVGAGSLIKPLLGFPFEVGVIGVGAVVILIVVTAGMVSTTWVQFIKGSMLVLFCGIITLALFARGFKVKGADEFPRFMSNVQFEKEIAPKGKMIEPTGPWAKLPYVRVELPDGTISTWQVQGQSATPPQLTWPSTFEECQTLTVKKDGSKLVNGKPQKIGENDLKPAGYVAKLPGEQQETGALDPLSFLSTFQHSEVGLPKSEKVTEADGVTTVYYAKNTAGSAVLTAGNHPTLFKGIKSHAAWDQLNFISFMLALFCGTAALPHILIRYYTVKDQKAARKSTVVGIAAIGLFYILTLYLGLGAMTQGRLEPDVTNSNMAAPLLAKAFGEFAFALISAIAFTTVLGTVSGLIMAASGAVAHDLMSSFLKMDLDDHAKVRAGKIAAVCVGIVAIILGIVFQKFNVAFLVAWAFNIAASANLPAITMLLFWKGTTKKGITASILVGLLSSLTWIMLSSDAYVNIYGMKATDAPMKMNQPALFTIPLAYLTLIVVSLFTKRTNTTHLAAEAAARA